MGAEATGHELHLSFSPKGWCKTNCLNLFDHLGVIITWLVTIAILTTVKLNRYNTKTVESGESLGNFSTEHASRAWKWRPRWAVNFCLNKRSGGLNPCSVTMERNNSEVCNRVERRPRSWRTFVYGAERKHHEKREGIKGQHAICWIKCQRQCEIRMDFLSPFSRGSIFLAVAGRIIGSTEKANRIFLYRAIFKRRGLCAGVFEIFYS